MFELFESIEEMLMTFAEIIDTINYNVWCDVENLKIFSEYVEKQISVFYGFSIFTCIALVVLLIMNFFLIRNQKRTRKELSEILEALKEKSEN